MLAISTSCSEYDTSYAAHGIGRFRVNVYRQRGSLAIVMRVIPFQVPTFEELGAPRGRARRSRRRIAGSCCASAPPATARAARWPAMIDHMNHTTPRHIVTIEDPIEFMHEDDKCSISQREIGARHARASPARSAPRCARTRT